MKLYLDTGVVDEIRRAVDVGVLDGVTTNPTLIMKSGAKFEPTIKEIVSVFNKADVKDFTVSAEVTAEIASEMVRQAMPLTKIDKHVVIKVPLTPEGIKACGILSKKKIKVNVTLCFSANQAVLAAKAGAFIVSPFVGRLDDIGHDGMELVAQIRHIYDHYGFKTNVLAASIRHPLHVVQSAEAGADICTMPFGVFEKMFNHALTDQGLERFRKDWQEYEGKQ